MRRRRALSRSALHAGGRLADRGQSGPPFMVALHPFMAALHPFTDAVQGVRPPHGQRARELAGRASRAAHVCGGSGRGGRERSQ
eukprot:1999776-Rhodomonas_salina.1